MTDMFETSRQRTYEKSLQIKAMLRRLVGRERAGEALNQLCYAIGDDGFREPVPEILARMGADRAEAEREWKELTYENQS